MTVKRLFEYAGRYVIRRVIPHGIVSWRYLLFSAPPKARIHRRLWMLGRPARMPAVLYWLMELILYVRWMVFAGWRATWRVVKIRGEAVRKHEGLSLALQVRNVLSVSLGYCIPPAEIYDFGLYRKESKKNIWNYVFTHELPAFHTWRNPNRGQGKSSAILQDKYQTAEILAAKGIPVAPVLKMVSRGDAFDLSGCLRSSPRLFCKPRHGSRSLNAFVVETTNAPDRMAIFQAINGRQAHRATPEQLREAMTTDDFLIQPFLINHPCFEILAAGPDVVTMRIITENTLEKGIICYCATLEIPNVDGNDSHNHIILPIDSATGLIRPFPVRHLPEKAQTLYAEMQKKTANFIIPGWSEIYRSAYAAHSCFPDIYGIAWDYVLTPQGPYLLEGNTGWGTKTPQMIYGGLLQKKFQEQ